MSSFDSAYANDRIDCILRNFATMMDLYKRLKGQQTPSQKDLRNLDELRTSVLVDISNYYTYLDECSVSPKDSYMTKWLDGDSFYDYVEEIEYFLHMSQQA
jgi:hypothetical protein